MSYTRLMGQVGSRELRNDTAGLLRRVESGEDVVITVNGSPAARLIPFRVEERRWIPRAELVGRLRRVQADPGLRADLSRLAGDSTDDLGPVR